MMMHSNTNAAAVATAPTAASATDAAAVAPIPTAASADAATPSDTTASL